MIVGAELVSWSAVLTLREAGCATVAMVSDHRRAEAYSAFRTLGRVLMNGPVLTGSRVVGIPLDGQGQDFLIIGSILKGGEGDIDQPAQFDSDIPQPAKSQQVGGETQPRYGDVNGVVTRESIVSYAESQGGGRSAKYAQVDDPIGTLDREIV